MVSIQLIIFFTADWLMIKYFHGDKYTHHCSGVERLAVVLITCDPGEQTVSYIYSQEIAL